MAQITNNLFKVFARQHLYHKYWRPIFFSFNCLRTNVLSDMDNLVHHWSCDDTANVSVKWSQVILSQKKIIPVTNTPTDWAVIHVMTYCYNEQWNEGEILHNTQSIVLLLVERLYLNQMLIQTNQFSEPGSLVFTYQTFEVNKILSSFWSFMRVQYLNNFTERWHSPSEDVRQVFITQSDTRLSTQWASPYSALWKILSLVG